MQNDSEATADNLFDVYVLAQGNRPVALAKMLHGVTGLALADVTARLEKLPARITSGLELPAAERLASKLAGAGATVEITPTGQKPSGPVMESGRRGAPGLSTRVSLVVFALVVVAAAVIFIWIGLSGPPPKHPAPPPAPTQQVAATPSPQDADAAAIHALAVKLAAVNQECGTDTPLREVTVAFEKLLSRIRHNTNADLAMIGAVTLGVHQTLAECGKGQCLLAETYGFAYATAHTDPGVEITLAEIAEYFTTVQCEGEPTPEE